LAFGGNTKDRLSYSEDKHDYPSPSRNEWPSKKWASDKYDKPSGHAYGFKGYDRTYGKAYSMHGDDDDKHYDVDYRSSKQWKRPSYPSKDSKDSREWKKPSKHSRDWKKDGDDYEPTEKYGHAYSQRGYERTYGKAYSMHKDEEPKANWKKSDYPSRNWKKNDEPKGHKDYAPKYEPKKPQWAKDDYKPKHGKKDYSSKDEPKHEPSDYEPQGHNDDYSSTDEPKHDEPSEYEEPKEDDDDNYGTAYALGLGGRCTSRTQCSSGCCEGPYGYGRCVEKKIDWTNVFAYCPAECVGCFGCRAGTC